MKTLRSKLFINIGAILLLSALFNTVISAIWVRKEVSQGGVRINQYANSIKDQAEQFSSFLLTFRIVQEACNLDRIAQMTSYNKGSSLSLWQKAGEIISYDPNISFIEIPLDQEKSIVISPKETKQYSFSMSQDQGGFFWVKVAGIETIFAAIPQPKQNKDFYLLFTKNEIKKLLPSELSMIEEPLRSTLTKILHSPLNELSSFTKIKTPSYPYNWKDSASLLFSSLNSSQNEWTKKITLIQALIPWQENLSPITPEGILEIDSDLKTGSCLFTKEAFSTIPLIQHMVTKENKETPFLMLRTVNNQEELDIVTTSLLSIDGRKEKQIALAFSLSSLLSDVATLINKTIVASNNEFSIGFHPDGSIFNTKDSQFPDSSEIKNAELPTQFLSWKGNEYSVSTIDLDILKIFILTPKEQFLSMSNFLENLGERISIKISLSLILAAFLSLLIALFFLHNVSKKITHPISTISKAFERLSKGIYEGITLPEVSKREDEVATLTLSFLEMVRALQDRDKIRGVLNKVVSKEISKQILENTIELGGEEKIVTLLFSDIRNFTPLAEGLSPSMLIEMLNAYMTRMCRIIDETHGVVDKFVGDEIMTLYGAPIFFNAHAANAIEAAVLMMKDLYSWNRERKQKNEPTFEIGIGIHTGLVYAGNMGAENRLNYTAIGANVNLASRLCSAAKPMQILISEETFNSLGVQKKFLFQKLDPIALKGIEKKIQTYEVIMPGHEK